MPLCLFDKSNRWPLTVKSLPRMQAELRYSGSRGRNKCCGEPEGEGKEQTRELKGLGR